MYTGTAPDSDPDAPEEEDPTIIRRVRVRGQWRGQKIYRPPIVADYNRYMSGVDLCDQMTAVNKGKKQQRWYMRVFIKFLLLAIYNAYIFEGYEIPHNGKGKRKRDLLKFKQDLYVQLVGTTPTRNKAAKRQRQNMPPKDRLENVGSHFPLEESPPQRPNCITRSSNLGQNSQDIDGLSETAASQPDQALISLELDAPRQNTNTNSKGKRKPSDGLQQKSIKVKVAKRSPENQRKVIVWSPDRIELLLAYLKEYKSTCEFNGRDFEQDLAAMYTEIRKCLAKDYQEEFGPQVTTEPRMPIKDMDSSEYQAFKKTLHKEQELIKKGYDRVKEKI
ncbi:hypothetical protein AWC38_SpisGene1986 [Stylophora pistillata]|uniref:PiggyBac transposable element-derived protein domain-containing protein n=1 Tax=Stylophora pistillata TaxID=50429 RepID=A0A2B4SXA5_STYPI|nr:hypothetical protein AWC38_SpisGene1986 [Stylophora pistillata]